MKDPLDTYLDPKAAHHFAKDRFQGRGKREREILRSLILEHGKKGPVLDVACGAGRLLPDLVPGATKIIGGDRAPAMLKEARAGLGTSSASIGLVCLDAFRLPFPDGSFETVVCLRLLHHFKNPDDIQGILLELSRVARGRVITSFFNKYSLQHLRRTVRSKLNGKRSQRHALSIPTFIRLAQNADLPPIAVSSVARFAAEQTLCVLGKRQN